MELGGGSLEGWDELDGESKGKHNHNTFLHLWNFQKENKK